MFRELLIDRLGNAHRIIVDRYSMGHSIIPEQAEADAEIASALRDAASYLRETGNQASNTALGSVPSAAPK